MNMKRLFQSVTGGIIIVMALCLIILALDKLILWYSGSISFERNPTRWLLEWPIPILNYLYPGEKLPVIGRLDYVGPAITLLVNALGYSMWVYIILRLKGWRNRLR